MTLLIPYSKALLYEKEPVIFGHATLVSLFPSGFLNLL